MPTIRLGADLEMHYLVDDYTDPWRKPETILLLHGNCESSAVWFAWVPSLARHFRVVRPDMRGFGASTPMPRDYPWSIDRIADDFAALMDALGIERFHLVGAKIGAHVARHFAARHTDRVSTLTLAGALPPNYPHTGVSERLEECEKLGMEYWARKTMSNRLGSGFPAEGVEWWIKLMGRTALSTQIGFVATIPGTDISRDLPQIACPTLVITTGSGGQSTVEETRAWQRQIPRSELLVLPGDSYHVAASEGERCAAETLAFIARSGPAAITASR